MEMPSENSTKRRILVALKKNGSMSVDNLSKKVNITPMGVRQHLLILERNGVVEYSSEKHGVGRPGFLYKLTDKADDLFPKSYQELLTDILTDIEKNDGRDKVFNIFERRKERLAAESASRLSGIDGQADRLKAFVKTLQDSGCIVEIDERADHFRFSQFNCPISKIAARFKEACACDLKIFEEVFGEDVTRQQCLSDGDQACVYIIPK